MKALRAVAAALAALAAVVLSGCAIPSTRAGNPGSFKVMASGNVGAPNASKMVDCVNDGFTRILSGLSSATVRQAKRSESTRVELVAGQYLLLSADVEDAGPTQLLESREAAGVPTRSEIAEYKACLARFAVK